MIGDRVSVLHVGKFYPPHRGGMENHLKTICTQLSRHMRVSALVWSDGKGSCANECGVRITRLQYSINLAGSPISAGIFRELRRSHEDLIHIHWPNPTAALAYVALARRKPLVVTWHSDVVRQRKLARLFAPLLRRFLESSRAIIVSSPNYLASSPTLATYRDRCRVVPFGIETAGSDRGQTDANALRNTHGDRIILAVGRLVYYKGLQHLIRAMRHVEGKLILIGEGPLRTELEAEARSAGVSERVVFEGNVGDVSAYYDACDVFVLPSVARSEAFGIVQLEAMAAGKPVINTALSSGVPFVSIDGLTGITVPPGDAQALAAAISRLLDDRPLREKYGQAGRHRVATQFSVDQMVRGTLDTYREAMGREWRKDSPRPWPRSNYA